MGLMLEKDHKSLIIQLS